LHEQSLEKLRTIGNGIYAVIGDKERMGTATLMVSGMLLAGYASKRGTKVIADYTAARWGKPDLVKESSRHSLRQYLFSPITTLKKISRFT